MKTKRTVLLFEDDPDERPVIAAALQMAMPKDVAVVPFTGGAGAGKGTYETRIKEHFKELGGADFIVCDQDLSLIPEYTGLSAQVVMGLAYAEGIPIAIYGRGKADFMTQRLKARKSFLDRRFVLHLDDQRWDAAVFAQKARIIFDGCQQVLAFLRENLNQTGKVNGQSPACWMSQLLRRPQIVNRLDLYGLGDQQYLSWLVASSAEDSRTQFTRVLAAELSYWLWDSILRFPGIVVNEVAAASLLNLSPATWKKPEVRKLFTTAKYAGPFGVDKEFWWRDDLQAIVRKAGVTDGLAFVKGKGIKGATRSNCCVDPKLSAGCYCMLAQKPVSRQQSIGDIPYFPSGADLARISRPEFEKVAPWVGLAVD
jgi:hypothetical protein